jgi:hypothetical protein
MSNSGAWGPAPPGVDLSENQNKDIIGSVVGIMVMGIASVVLRVFTRLMHKGPGLAADDFVIIFAAVRERTNFLVFFFLERERERRRRAFGPSVPQRLDAARRGETGREGKDVANSETDTMVAARSWASGRPSAASSACPGEEGNTSGW